MTKWFEVTISRTFAVEVEDYETSGDAEQYAVDQDSGPYDIYSNTIYNPDNTKNYARVLRIED